MVSTMRRGQTLNATLDKDEFINSIVYAGHS